MHMLRPLKWIAKQILGRVAANDPIYDAFDRSIGRGIDYVRMLRFLVERDRNSGQPSLEEKFLNNRIPDLVVRHGPFRGMRYPQARSVGSMVVPKLIGSYEKEIHPFLDRICGVPYTAIVDVGCAEGYYAIGLAMRISNATVYAFDTNIEAIVLCRAMAELNGVSDRLVTGEFCSPETLASLDLGSRALIVSDCEGYEGKLFTRPTVEALANHDVLVEVHDFLDIELSSSLREVFSETHEIHAVKSVDDVEKARTYVYEELEGFDLASRKILLAENRRAVMDWFFMTPRRR
jgi:precorrin-6B methylase 2